MYTLYIKYCIFNVTTRLHISKCWYTYRNDIIVIFLSFRIMIKIKNIEKKLKNKFI